MKSVFERPFHAAALVATGFSLMMLLIASTVAGSKRCPAGVSASIFTSAYMISSYGADVHFGLVPNLPTWLGAALLLLAVGALSFFQARHKDKLVVAACIDIEKGTSECSDGNGTTMHTADNDGSSTTEGSIEVQSQPSDSGSSAILESFLNCEDCRSGEQALAEHIVKRCPLTRFQLVNGSRWGHLIVPECPARADPVSACSLRVVLLTSSEPGKVMLEAVTAFAEKFPGSLQLVGVATDHAVDPGAKICLKKRFWRYAEQPLRLLHESALVESAISAGVEVYTGEIKCDGFRHILGRWSPHVIISAAFGQKLDAAIIDTPPLGTYNFHPSDLLGGHGAGTSPWEDLECTPDDRRYRCW